MKTKDSTQNARRYIEKGIAITPVEGKQPILNNWQNTDLTIEDIHRYWGNGHQYNIGIRLGAPSSGLIDIDLDCPEAVAIAGRFLPPTLTSGRESSPHTHWWYRVPDAETAKYRDIDGTMLIELRSTGCQTVVWGVHPDGDRYLWHSDSGLDIAAVERGELEEALKELATATLIARHLPPIGGRHDFARALGGYLLRRLDEDTALKIMRAAWDAPGWASERDRRGAHRDLEGIVQDTAEKMASGEPVQGGGVLGEIVEKLPRAIAKIWGWGQERESQRTYLCTDLGNAERFADQHRDNVRYCFPFKAWYVYDSRRWRRDTTGEVVRRAKDTARTIFEEAAKAPDNQAAKELGKWAVAAQSEKRIKAMLELAKSEPGIPVTPDELDADPFLFNCTNGTIDLKTGKLREHRREDLITKVAPVHYDPNAKSALFEEVLDAATIGKPGLKEFLKRWAGYCLTGDTGEEKLAFVHGDRATAKSTVLEAVKATMGDYAATADFEAFLSRSSVGGPRNDIARLAGARLVVSIEVDEGKRLAEGLVKMLTGGDTVTARFLYQEAFEFTPTFKLTLAANHAPKVRDDDAAMWRRILRVPFENVIPESNRNPDVKRRLKNIEESGPSILAWAVEGCLEWQRSGLGVPDSVKEATQELREEMDPLRGFIADCCTLDPEVWAYAGELRETYEEWARESGAEELLRGKRWGERLRALGCRQTTDASGKRRIWKGIAVRYGPKEPDDGSRDSEPSAVPTESVGKRVGSQTTCKSQETKAGNGQVPTGFLATDRKIQKLCSDSPHEGGFTENLSEPVGRQKPVGSDYGAGQREDYDSMVEDRMHSLEDELGCHHGVKGGCWLCRKQSRSGGAV